MSAWNWQRKSLAAAPPSTRRVRMGTPESAAMASSTSRLWKAMASSEARARWARARPRVGPAEPARAAREAHERAARVGIPVGRAEPHEGGDQVDAAGVGHRRGERVGLGRAL